MVLAVFEKPHEGQWLEQVKLRGKVVGNELTGVSSQRLWYSELAGESLEGLGRGEIRGDVCSMSLYYPISSQGQQQEQQP